MVVTSESDGKLSIEQENKKLNKEENKTVLKAYEEILSKQLEEDVIEEVKSNLPPNGIVHYLPHHCVINTEKATTKVRIVYDGSAKANRKRLISKSMFTRRPVIS